MRLAALLTATAITALGLATPAGATVLTFTASAQSVNSNNPTTFTFNLATPIVPITGLVDVSLTIGGAFGDGKRDGVSLIPVGAGLASVNLGGATVATAGGAQSFAGAGGTMGSVLISPFVAHNLGIVNQFTNSAATVIVPRADRTESQGAIAGAVLDGQNNGVTLTGNHPGNAIAALGALAGASAVPGTYFIGVPTVSSTFSATGSGVMECTTGAACTGLSNDVAFTLPGLGDVAAMVVRQELGGDPISGTVVDDYDLQTGTGVYDCGAGPGCLSVNLTVEFTLAGLFDTAAFVMRVEIEPASTTAVLEPTALALFGPALALFGFTRRRALGSSSTAR